MDGKMDEQMDKYRLSGVLIDEQMDLWMNKWIYG